MRKTYAPHWLVIQRVFWLSARRLCLHNATNIMISLPIKNPEGFKPALRGVRIAGFEPAISSILTRRIPKLSHILKFAKSKYLWWESNPHVRRQRFLRAPRIPIPPQRQAPVLRFWQPCSPTWTRTRRCFHIQINSLPRCQLRFMREWPSSTGFKDAWRLPFINFYVKPALLPLSSQSYKWLKPFVFRISGDQHLVLSLSLTTLLPTLSVL